MSSAASGLGAVRLGSEAGRVLAKERRLVRSRAGPRRHPGYHPRSIDRERRAAPREREESWTTMDDAGVFRGEPPLYAPLSEAAMERVIDATYQLMRETGVAFHADAAVLDRLSSAGCDISADNVVRFDRELVEECLSTVARSARLWNRDGSESVEINARDTLFMPGMTNIRIFDLESGEPRDSTREDLATVTRVADALGNIDGVCVSVKDVPDSTLRGEIGEFAVMTENTTKPLQYLCENSVAFEAAIEMAAAIRGGMDRLAEKPYFVQTITPLPLYYAETHCDQIVRGAECGVPVIPGTIAIGGASAPFTIAGCLTHALATDFAGVVLSQLVRKGAFCGGSSEPAFIEPATGGIGSKTRTLLAEMAISQVKRHMGLPALATTSGEAAARRFNQDAVWEITAGMMAAFYVRPGSIDYMGGLEAGLTFSLHALLLCEDLAGMLRSLWEGIPVDDDQLALDVSRTIGPNGNWLAERHTAKHCREAYWRSRYFGARLPLSSGLIPDEDLFERIDADLRQILDTHEPEPLPEALWAEIGEIARKSAAG
jgi:trimethylamine:corrinoid methyltransferase-like protein